MNNSQVKRQRLNHDGTDRINSLPDGVLIHMLSFLPTADAVRTCILSKRWEFLWTYLRNINFDDRLYLGEVNMWNPQPGLTRFLDGIGDELVSQFMFDMKKLRLSFRVFFDAIRVHNWLVSAILRKVLEVDLCLFVGEPFILPEWFLFLHPLQF
ncbi:putative F-box/LRR-repeat protein [Vitis vinifera]|uniref:Putative F-box/LRR-repeat protein n=1 Tax=Vitis vinifera TaxID=29760 RepID=A0A438ISN7_VITVI|nr:putative F-box/LRR-repeat protein [Vitis vinifera]